MLDIYFGDNLSVLKNMPDRSVNLIYIDPPFNTGKMQLRTSMTMIGDEEGDRVGFKGRRYKTIRRETRGYNDVFDDLPAFLRPRMEEARRILADDGSLFFHIDYREVHYCKVMLDEIFGRDSFINEIIWAYDYGARSRRRWSAKHDNILWYAKNPASYTFNYEAMDRIPYMAPSLVGPKKAARGKTPTDVWWHTIVSPTGQEKTGYATQKPLGILRRIVAVHSRPDDVLCDFFAGSGSFGAAALEQGRSCVLVDENPSALYVMEKRFKADEVIWHDWETGQPEPEPEKVELVEVPLDEDEEDEEAELPVEEITKDVRAKVRVKSSGSKKSGKKTLEVIIDPDGTDVLEAALAVEGKGVKKTAKKTTKKAATQSGTKSSAKKTSTKTTSAKAATAKKTTSAKSAVKKSSVAKTAKKSAVKAETVIENAETPAEAPVVDEEVTEKKTAKKTAAKKATAKKASAAKKGTAKTAKTAAEKIAEAVEERE